MEYKECDLVLKLQIESNVEMRYGNKLTCKVIEVIKGLLADKEIMLMLFTSGKKLDDILKSGVNEQIEIGFIKKHSNEVASTIASNGFIDGKRTSWEIVYLQKAGKK